VHMHPIGLKKSGAKFTGESYKAECACPRQRKSRIVVGNWRDLDGGSGYLGSFNPCFEGDD